MPRIDYDLQFERNYKRCMKKHLPLELLDDVVKLVVAKTKAGKESTPLLAFAV